MVESASVVAVVVVVAGVVGAVPAALGAGPTDGAAAAGAANGTANESVAPGARLAGVVGVERAAVRGELSERAFERRVAVAGSNASRAQVIGAEVESLQQRLDELEARETQLRAAYENGSLSTGEYRARMAQLHAEQRALQRLANRTGQAAAALPAETLAANGVNVTAIRQLRADAANLTGPEVSEIARSIAGKRAGQGLGPDDAGPPAFAGTNGGPPEDAGPSDASNESDDPGQGPPDESDAGNDDNPGQGPPENDGNESDGNPGQGDSAAGDGSDGSDASDGNDSSDAGDGTGNGDDAGGSDAASRGDLES